MKKLTDLLCLCQNVKKTSVNELYAWINWERDWDWKELGDYYLRQLSHDVVQISVHKRDFDRWANSGGEYFDLARTAGRKQFLNILQGIDLSVAERLAQKN
ncbi:hypothetical protein LMH73_016910 [Vibrio splendidus]|nr:hypothetical protein [Vibrio splendidus]MCC4881838.1 hypothetical protein [Vibrio splendidus]